MRATTGVPVAVAVAWLLWPTSATACSAPTCRPEYAMLPGRIPANAPGFYWEPSHTQVWDPPETEVVDSSVIFFRPAAALEPDAGASSNVALELSEVPLLPGGPWLNRYSNHVVSFAEPLQPNTTYHFERPGYCDDVHDPGVAFESSTVVATTEPVPLPTALGELVVTPATKSWTSSTSDLDGIGVCQSYVESVIVEYQVELGDAAPWADLLLYWSVVDGLPYVTREGLNDPWWHAPSPAPGGHGYIWVSCDERAADWNPPGALDPGIHSIQMAAWLPGSDLVVVSDTVDVDIRCVEEPAEVDALDAGAASLPTDASASPDEPTSDPSSPVPVSDGSTANPMDADAGASGMSSDDAGADTTPSSPDDAVEPAVSSDAGGGAPGATSGVGTETIAPDASPSGATSAAFDAGVTTHGRQDSGFDGPRGVELDADAPTALGSDEDATSQGCQCSFERRLSSSPHWWVWGAIGCASFLRRKKMRSNTKRRAPTPRAGNKRLSHPADAL